MISAPVHAVSSEQSTRQRPSWQPPVQIAGHVALALGANGLQLSSLGKGVPASSSSPVPAVVPLAPPLPAELPAVVPLAPPLPAELPAVVPLAPPLPEASVPL